MEQQAEHIHKLEMSAAAMAAKTAELLKCTDTDFEKTIEEMSLKDLLDSVTLLQKEMTKEQENFNALGTELGALNKNSQQYKQISKEMNQSQSRLTVLMNRSMKCFQQQGNQQLKQKPGNNQVQRRNSARSVPNSESGSNVQRRHSAKIKAEEAEAIKTSLDKSTAVKSTPNLDSTNQTKPVILKPLATVDTSRFNLRKNEPQGQKHSSSVIVNSPQVVQQNGNKSTVKTEPKTSVINVNPGNQVNSTPQKSVTVIKTGVSIPRPKIISQNGVTSSVTRNEQSDTSTKQPFEASGPKVDISNSESKQNGGDNVTGMSIQVNGLTQQKPPQKLIKSSEEQPSGGNLLEQIRNFRRPYESDDTVLKASDEQVKQSKPILTKPVQFKENKVEKKEFKVVQRNSQEQKPPVIFHGGRPVVLDSGVEQSRKTMLDQIKAHKKSDTQHEQIAELEKEKKPVPLGAMTNERVKTVTEPVQAKRSQAEVKSVSGSGKVSMATISLQRNSGEVIKSTQTRETVDRTNEIQAETTQLDKNRVDVQPDRTENEINEPVNEPEEPAEPEEKPEKFRTEFSFPSKTKRAPVPIVQKPTQQTVPTVTKATSDVTLKQHIGEVNGALRRIDNISAIRNEIKVKVQTIHVVHVCGM